MLIYDAMEKFIMMDATTSSDGRGGLITKWVDGAEFDAAIEYQGSSINRIAEALKEKSTYRIITFKSVYLPPLSVIRRLSNGQILRVTKESHDAKTPSGASFDLRATDAEDFDPAEYNNG